MIASKFPQAKIFATIGNNDVIFHYQATLPIYSDIYYAFLFKTWFTDVPANAQLPQIAEIETTFMQGGWYRVDIAPNVALMSINTLFYSIHDDFTSAPE
jgi:hypothetical protein